MLLSITHRGSHEAAVLRRAPHGGVGGALVDVCRVPHRRRPHLRVQCRAVGQMTPDAEPHHSNLPGGPRGFTGQV
eukprot:8491135-Pyramimonas_sp.AAC.1